MTARDPHRHVNELDAAAVERLIARLESRAKDAVFTRLFDRYAQRLVAWAPARVLEIGCGTGAVIRALCRRSDFRGAAVGVDHGSAFIAAARRFARDEGLGENARFEVGDAHRLDFPDGAFDAVIAHTVISHVADPATVLREMARVLRPGGLAVVFDGDYASLTYAHEDADFGRRMDESLVRASFCNPRIMRELPRILPGFGLSIRDAWGDAVTEIGQARFFESFSEAYAPYVAAAGLMPRGAVQSWLDSQRAAARTGTFFASCVYCTILAGKG